MNFLQLAQAVKRESGLSGGGPVSAVTATGDDARIFAWVNWAARDITLQREDWRFRRGMATLASTTNAANSAAAFGLTDFASWKREDGSYQPSAYRLSDGGVMERPLKFVEYDYYRMSYLTGAGGAGAAMVWSVAPNEDFLIGPTPDAAHFVRADYVKGYTDLVENTDTPLIPERFHMMIVWRALMEYGGYDAATEVAQRASGNYGAMWTQLAQSQLDTPRFAARSL